MSIPLVTIMNYSDPAGIAMCKGWLYLARRFCPDTQIIVLHRDPIPEITKFAATIGNVHMNLMSTDGIPGPEVCGKYGRPAQYFKIGLWRWIDKARLDHFVFIDADAWIVRDISKLFEASTAKVFVATTERILGESVGIGKPLINTGVFAYNGGSKFTVTFKLFMDELAACDNQIQAPTGEQGLLWSYFDRIGYDWTLPEIGTEYNTFAYKCRVEKVGGEIEVYAGKKPEDADQWVGSWLQWGNNAPARILHAISMFKWWSTKEAAPLWDYVIGEVAAVERSGTAYRDRKAASQAANVNIQYPKIRKREALLSQSPAAKLEISPSAPRAIKPGLVSVVMPTYNRPDFLRHAIGMVRLQTYRNIELIIVEDSDRDFLLQEIKSPSIKHIQLSTKCSTGKKHDIGLAAADGEWVCHWDDDDWFSADRIERQLEAMREAKADVSGFEIDKVLTTKDGKWWSLDLRDDRSRVGNAPLDVLYRFHDGTAIFRRDAIGSGASYEDRSVGQKVAFLNSIMKAGASWVALPNEGRFVYVRHATNSWKFDEAKVMIQAEAPKQFPSYEHKFYVEMGRNV